MAKVRTIFRIIVFKTRIGRFLTGSLIAIELFVIEYLRGNPINYDNSNLTISIKTFERQKTVLRLLGSIRKYYPNIKIIVVDDSRKPFSSADLNIYGNIDLITTEYDVGVSAGRNIALGAVETKYVMVLDDDYIFYRKTDIRKAIDILEKSEEVDLVAGSRVDLPFFRQLNMLGSILFPVAATPLFKEGLELFGGTVLYKTPNFYIARTSKVKEVGWDINLKRVDHKDFFSRAIGVLTCIQIKEFKVLHAQDYSNDTYNKSRNDVAADFEYLQNKYFR